MKLTQNQLRKLARKLRFTSPFETQYGYAMPDGSIEIRSDEMRYTIGYIARFEVIGAQETPSIKSLIEDFNDQISFSNQLV